MGPNSRQPPETTADPTARRRVRDVMTISPACCFPETPVNEVAVLLADHDCGAIPVVENGITGRPVGVVTDRDVVCRVVAAGRDPAATAAADCMTAPCITAAEEMSLEECVALMEGNRVRRIVVVNDSGAVCGIVAQADVALKAEERTVAQVLRTVSEPTAGPNDVVR
jgi:CBS domain-containing protein